MVSSAGTSAGGSVGSTFGSTVGSADLGGLAGCCGEESGSVKVFWCAGGSATFSSGAGGSSESLAVQSASAGSSACSCEVVCTGGNGSSVLTCGASSLFSFGGSGWVSVAPSCSWLVMEVAPVSKVGTSSLVSFGLSVVSASGLTRSAGGSTGSTTASPVVGSWITLDSTSRLGSSASSSKMRSASVWEDSGGCGTCSSAGR